MQHKCTVCGRLYEQGSLDIMNGCDCGNKLFYFINNKKDKSKSDNLQYFYELEDEENSEIIVFDLETVNIRDQGKYEIDIDALMKNDGLVYRYGEGKYSIDIAQNFSKIKQKR